MKYEIYFALNCLTYFKTKNLKKPGKNHFLGDKMDDNKHLEAAVVGVAVCGGEQRVRAVDPGEDGHEPDTQPHQPGEPDHAASPPHRHL